MSGGHFDYKQYYIQDLIDQIEEEIKGNKYKKEDDIYSVKLNDKTIKEFENAVKALKIAKIYATRIDWLLSGDDDEETFHERLKDELNELNSS